MVKWTPIKDAYYSLILSDPDAPSRVNPTLREVRHWLVVNIPGKNIAKGDTLAPFLASGPPEGTGLHRYIFLVYQQKHGKQVFDEKPIRVIP